MKNWAVLYCNQYNYFKMMRRRRSKYWRSQSGGDTHHLFARAQSTRRGSRPPQSELGRRASLPRGQANCNCWNATHHLQRMATHRYRQEQDAEIWPQSTRIRFQLRLRRQSQSDHLERIRRGRFPIRPFLNPGKIPVRPRYKLIHFLFGY